MQNNFKKIILVMVLCLSMTFALIGCGKSGQESSAESTTAAETTEIQTTAAQETTEAETTTAEESTEADSSDGAEDEEDEDSIFTKRDLEQEADLSEAEEIVLADDKDVTITEEGIYLVSGSAENTTIRVEAVDAKVQIVLDGVTITNEDAPAIYVVDAKKVFITTTEGSQNSLTVTGVIEMEGETNLDAVIYSKDDLVLNGLGTLNIESTDNGIVCKDDLKATGGTYVINAVDDGIEVKDSVSICGGDFTIDSGKDCIHVENDEDYSKGSIYIEGGTFNLTAAKQGLQAMTTIVINGGEFNIQATEGMEATYIQINDGTIYISASDDGLNASANSSDYDVLIEINGGTLTIVMGAGDTDAVDANGSIVVNGGYIDITGQSSFDYDVSGTLNGGTVYVNGTQITEMPEGMQGGRGGMGGGHMK